MGDSKLDQHVVSERCFFYVHSFRSPITLRSRKDIRHNFSVYYLMFYLMAESDWLPVLSMLAFLPQLLLLCKMSYSLFRHLELVFFVNTAIFVTFNKVVTSQVKFVDRHWITASKSDLAYTHVPHSIFYRSIFCGIFASCRCWRLTSRFPKPRL